MSREVVCPTCGMRLVLDERPEGPVADPSSPQASTLEVLLPQTVAADDLGFVAAPASERLCAEGSDASGIEVGLGLLSESLERPPAEPIFETVGVYPGTTSLRSSDCPDAVATSQTEPPRTPRGSRPWKPAFPSIKTDSDRGLSLRGGRDRFRRSRASARKLGRVALISYASAMTVACLWLTWKLRTRDPDTETQRVTYPGASPVDPRGKRGDRGFQVPPATAIPVNRLIPIGKPIEIGSLRFTPLEVRSTSVTLVRRPAEGDRSVRDGGGGILVLSIRLENLSTDQVFAPLDEAFLREPNRGLPDSYIEAADGRIYSYRLPVESDWSIEGQDFRELKPGEVVDTIIASDEGALARTSELMTWRLRLRTGSDPDNTEVIGVQFRRDQIQ